MLSLAGYKLDQTIETVTKTNETIIKTNETIATLSELEFANWRHDTNSSASTASGQTTARFRDSLIRFYGFPNEQIQCMVTDLLLSRKSIIAGHIISKRNAERAHALFGFDVNDPRNGLLWCRPIEAAWSYNQICFAFDTGK